MKTVKIWATRLLFTALGVIFLIAGTWIFSRGFMMSNSSAADLCFGTGIITFTVGAYAIVSVFIRARS